MVTPPESGPGARIAAAEEAFERGDYRLAGNIARALLAATAENAPPGEDDALVPAWSDEQRRAERLLERLRPDPLIKLLLAGSALLLLVLTLISYGMTRGQ